MPSLEQVGLALQGFGEGFQGRGAQFQQGLAKRQATQQKLSKERVQAAANDALGIRNLLAQGRPDLAAQMVQSRIQSGGQLGGDMGESQQLLSAIQGARSSEDLRGVINELDDDILKFQAAGVLETPKSEILKGGDVTGQGQVIREDSQGNLVAQDVAGFRAAPEKKAAAQTPLQKAQTDKIREELRQLKLQDKSLSKDDLAVIKQEKIDTTKKNVARIAELSKGVKSRASAINKASKFLRKFKTGGAQSGTTRTVASALPGVFTEQGQFDEELDSFSEVAAREKLKAVGEIRPTDADVEGMKRALFGIGRDEETNINLLQEFIDEQGALDDELDDLRASKTAGGLSTFTGSVIEQPAVGGVKFLGFE